MNNDIIQCELTKVSDKHALVYFHQEKSGKRISTVNIGRGDKLGFWNFG